MSELYQTCNFIRTVANPSFADKLLVSEKGSGVVRIFLDLISNSTAYSIFLFEFFVSWSYFIAKSQFSQLYRDFRRLKPDLNLVDLNRIIEGLRVWRSISFTNKDAEKQLVKEVVEPKLILLFHHPEAQEKADVRVLHGWRRGAGECSRRSQRPQTRRQHYFSGGGRTAHCTLRWVDRWLKWFSWVFRSDYASL